MLYSLKSDINKQGMNTKVMVGICPHDVVNDPEKWTAFTSYLLAKLKLNGTFEKYFSFETFTLQFKRLNFIYAHPLDAVHLRRDHHFIPLAKYSKKFDEAVIICQKTLIGKKTSEIDQQTVSCVYGSPSHAAVLIDFHINSKKISFQPLKKGSYPEVAVDVATHQATFGIILKEVWDTMKAEYPQLEVFYSTFTKKLVHVFMLSPVFSSMQNEFTRELLAMKNDPEGRKILQRLGCQEFEVFTNEQLDELEKTLEICQF